MISRGAQKIAPMISLEMSRAEVAACARTEVRNLPGMFFGSGSPLLKPFMKKLEELMPPEKRGRGDSYTLTNLYSHIDEVHADEEKIHVRSGENVVEIKRGELGAMMDEKHPTTGHHRLSLPGLFFLQSSPAVQAAATAKLQQMHDLRLPSGRRALRYIFHAVVVSLDADKERIKIGLDLDRLPSRPDGSSVLS